MADMSILYSLFSKMRVDECTEILVANKLFIAGVHIDTRYFF